MNAFSREDKCDTDEKVELKNDNVLSFKTRRDESIIAMKKQLDEDFW